MTIRAASRTLPNHQMVTGRFPIGLVDIIGTRRPNLPETAQKGSEILCVMRFRPRANLLEMGA